jgi:acyl-CoA thioester hydrolase
MPEEFEKVFEIRWDDVDSNLHLRNTRYIEYASYARLCYLEEAGYPIRRLLETGVGAVLLSEKIEYRKEAYLSQLLTVRLQVTGLSADGDRWRMFHTFLDAGGATAATLTSYGAWIDVRVRKIISPPWGLLSMMRLLCSAECESIE